MSAGRVTTAPAGVEHVPAEVRRCHRLTDPDYADFFSLDHPGAATATAEEWARGVLERSLIGRTSARRLWRALGLRLGPRGSADHVQGWRIADRGEDWIRVETGSWYLTAHAVVRVEQDRVGLSLFLRWDKPIAPLVWAPVSPMHRRGVPVMLADAAALHTASTQR